MKARAKRALALPLWAQLGPLSRWLARRRPMQPPPVLLIALPRSGSSWVGETLGASPEAAYLREPLTQSPRLRRSGQTSVYEVAPERMPRGGEAALAREADCAFAGVPQFPLRVVEWPAQFAYRERPRRRVVVKEVNLLALPWLLRRYGRGLRVIYLTRHPAAVAASYHRLGWTEPQLAPRFSDKTLRALGARLEPLQGDFWAEHGAMQALAHRQAHRALARGCAPHLTVCYEDLCRAPVAGFRQMYAFAGLRWTAGAEQRVRQRSSASGDRSNAYGTRRDSEAMAAAWTQDVPADALAALQAAYLPFDPPCYRDDWS